MMISNLECGSGHAIALTILQTQYITEVSGCRRGSSYKSLASDQWKDTMLLLSLCDGCAMKGYSV